MLQPPCSAPRGPQQPGWTGTDALRGSPALQTVWQSDPECLSELERKKALNGGDGNGIIQCLSVLLIQADFGRKSSVKNQ